MILLGLRESALLCQGLLFEPKASSAPGTMILADSRSLSSIRRRSPARTDVTSPAYVRSTIPAYVRSTIPAYAPSTLRTLLPCTEKDGHPKPRQPPFPHTSYIGNRNIEKYLFINSVNCITSQKSLDIINRNIHNSLSGSLRSPGNMRSDDAVLSLKKRVIPFDRLSRNNIKTSSINLATVQSIRKILLNNPLTTAVVDKDNSILLPLFARTITSPG